MTARMLTDLRQLREHLLRQVVLANGPEKAEILIKIMDLDEMIAEEEKAAQLT